jgi:hypothetical protein
MPVVIPIIAAAASIAAGAAGSAAIGAITIAGISIAASTVGAIIGGIAALAVTFVGSAIFGTAAQPQNSTSNATNRGQQIKSPVSAHQIIVGTVKVSGTLAYIYSPPQARVGYESCVFGYASHDFQPNQLLYMVTVLAGHQVASVHDITLDNNLAANPMYIGYAHVEYANGDPTQAANGAFVLETDGQWTSYHRLQGRAALFTTAYYSVSASMPFEGVPNPAGIVDGAICYDPRTGLEAFTHNPALIIAWYLMADFGMRCDQSEIDMPALIAAANVCDEAVELLTGATEPRYTCNGTFTLDQNPGQILDNMKACMDGGVIFSGGVWYIFAGATVAPSFTITQDMLRGPVVVQANRSAKDSFNAVRATYIRPEANWQATDAPIRYDEDAVQADGETVYQTLDFPFCTSGYTVQRLMQIALRRNRAERSITLQVNMSGLFVRPWDVVNFGTDRLPSATYRVTDWTLQDQGVDMLLEAEPADIYLWVPGTDELELNEVALGGIPGAYTLAVPEFTIGTPTQAVPSSVIVSVEQQPYATDAEVQVITGLTSGLWQAQPRGAFTVDCAVQGTAHFRVRSRADVQLSAWTEDDPPLSPTGVTAAAGSGSVSVSWTLGAGTTRSQVFAGTSSDYGSSALIYDGAAATASVAFATGTAVNVWVRSVDAIGNYSLPGGPVPVTAG